jgi:hypothetical protein
MTFKLSTATSYPWRVSGQIAGTRYTFTGHFAFLDQERIDQLTVQTARRGALLKRGEDAPELEGVTALAIASEVLIGWGEDVVDDDDQPVPFTAQAADRFLRQQGVAAAVVDAWAESLQGAPRGNSKAPRGIG